MSGELPEEPKAQGRDVVIAIGETMHKGLEPLVSRTLAPSLYLVYLHPRDHDRLRAVFPRIEEEARLHLSQELERLSRAAVPLGNRLLALLGPKLPAWLRPRPREGMRFEAAEGGFYVRFQEDPAGELGPGEIKVTADLAVGEEPGYGGGSPTHRISTTRRLGKGEPGPRTVTGTAPVLATFHYEDDGGPKTFAMVRDEIVLGRRAPDRWVDLHLETAFDVSREHARVRHQDGRFEIKDLSKLGTTVNGSALPSSLELVDGKTQDTERWSELPDGARIELAGKVRLTFRKGR